MDTVARWHPWPEKSLKEKTPHLLTLWDQGRIWRTPDIFSPVVDVEEIIEAVGRGRQYLFCSDPLDPFDLSFSDELLRDERATAFMQKMGKVVAVRIRGGRYSGFLIPARTWGYAGVDFSMLDSLKDIFEKFQYEAITAAALSEKILRSTMPEKIYIYRPACHLREVLLENNGGGRIDMREEGKFYKKAFKYDINKAYLYFAQLVPDPRFPPKYHIRPRESWFYDYATPGYWRVTMVAHGSGIHPIFLTEEGKRRVPKEGEQFTRWLWRDEIMACERKGYTLLFIHEGYRWPETSDFLKPWGDILWTKFSQTQDEDQQRIIKNMMVGLPGRFLKEPYNYLLIPRGEQVDSDQPIPYNWVHHADNWQKFERNNPRKVFSNWYLRKEYHEESTALTPIGAYIIMQCRLEIARLAMIEELKGNELISSYIDCAVFAQPATSLSLGPLPGQYKEERLTDVWAERNILISAEDMRAPGFEEGEERSELWKKYQERKYC
jgi:hypothetical protein